MKPKEITGWILLLFVAKNCSRTECLVEDKTPSDLMHDVFLSAGPGLIHQDNFRSEYLKSWTRNSTASHRLDGLEELHALRRNIDKACSENNWLSDLVGRLGNELSDHERREKTPDYATGTQNHQAYQTRDSVVRQRQARLRGGSRVRVEVCASSAESRNNFLSDVPTARRSDDARRVVNNFQRNRLGQCELKESNRWSGAGLRRAGFEMGKRYRDNCSTKRRSSNHNLWINSDVHNDRKSVIHWKRTDEKNLRESYLSIENIRSRTLSNLNKQENYRREMGRIPHQRNTKIFKTFQTSREQTFNIRNRESQTLNKRNDREEMKIVTISNHEKEFLSKATRNDRLSATTTPSSAKSYPERKMSFHAGRISHPVGDRNADLAIQTSGKTSRRISSSASEKHSYTASLRSGKISRVISLPNMEQITDLGIQKNIKTSSLDNERKAVRFYRTTGRLSLPVGERYSDLRNQRSGRTSPRTSSPVNEQNIHIALQKSDKTSQRISLSNSKINANLADQKNDRMSRKISSSDGRRNTDLDIQRNGRKSRTILTPINERKENLAIQSFYRTSGRISSLSERNANLAIQRTSRRILKSFSERNLDFESQRSRLTSRRTSSLFNKQNAYLEIQRKEETSRRTFSVDRRQNSDRITQENDSASRRILPPITERNVAIQRKGRTYEKSSLTISKRDTNLPMERKDKTTRRHSITLSPVIERNGDLEIQKNGRTFSRTLPRVSERNSNLERNANLLIQRNDRTSRRIATSVAERNADLELLRHDSRESGGILIGNYQRNARSAIQRIKRTSRLISSSISERNIHLATQRNGRGYRGRVSKAVSPEQILEHYNKLFLQSSVHKEGISSSSLINGGRIENSLYENKDSRMNGHRHTVDFRNARRENFKQISTAGETARRVTGAKGREGGSRNHQIDTLIHDRIQDSMIFKKHHSLGTISELEKVASEGHPEPVATPEEHPDAKWNLSGRGTTAAAAIVQLLLGLLVLAEARPVKDRSHLFGRRILETVFFR